MDNRQYDRNQIDPIEMVFDEIKGSRGKYENVTVLFKEVSLQGVLFTTNIDFMIDEILRFCLPSIGVLCLFSGKIVWKKELGADMYQYGLHIIDDQLSY